MSLFSRRCLSFLFVMGILANGFMPYASAEDDFQDWSSLSLKLVDTKYVDFANYSEMRLTDDVSDVGYWQNSQKVMIDPWKHLSLGMTYTYLENKVADTKRHTEELKYHHRFELEATPKWEVSPWLKLKNRNRMEFRWIEDQGSDNTRYRQQWEAAVPVRGVRWVEDVYVNNEFFVDFNRHKIAENRVTPFGITFRLCRQIQLKLFYLIQIKKGKADWSSNQVFGQQLVVTF